MIKPIPPPDLWTRLADAEQKAQINGPAQRNPNQFTRAEYSKRNNIRRTTAESRIRKLLEIGSLKRTTVWVQNVNGIWHPVPGYELVE